MTVARPSARAENLVFGIGLFGLRESGRRQKRARAEAERDAAAGKMIGHEVPSG
jgi:hypothetical protein